MIGFYDFGFVGFVSELLLNDPLDVGFVAKLGGSVMEGEEILCRKFC